MKTKRKLSQEEIDRFYLWLRDYPGYKELIRQRISDEQKYRRKRQQLFDTREQAAATRYGHDKLGREVEGCG